jgi:hypothetical protein
MNRGFEQLARFLQKTTGCTSDPERLTEPGVEIWERGTNRVIEECQRYGMPPPTLEERAAALS